MLCLAAVFFNGERSFIVAFLAMIFAAAVFYTRKIRIIVAALVALSLLGVGFYYASKTLPPRYNLAHMLDNFLVVWRTAPVEMGKFDAICFSDHEDLECAKESRALGMAEIEIEHSALSRLNMTKSLLLAILDSPLTPHLVGPFQASEYLYFYYQRKNPQNRSYITPKDHPQNNGYNHLHNYALTLFFCYGALGFAAIIAFNAWLISCGIRGVKSGDSWVRFAGLSLCIAVAGLCVQSFFDSIYSSILQCWFVVFGIFSGFLLREDSAHLSRS